MRWRAGFLQPWTITRDMARDYGKPGMNTSDIAVRHQLVAPLVNGVWHRKSDGAVLLQLKFDAALHTEYGAPAEVWIRYTAGEGTSRTLAVEVSLINKTSTRLPEAMFLSFDPPPRQHRPGIKWSMQKLDSWLDPSETLDGGAKGLHAVSDTGLRCAIGDDVLTVGSKDAALLHWGEPTPFPNPTLRPVNTTEGASYVLFNNLYNTNYVLWWPFDADPATLHDSVKFRFTLELAGLAPDLVVV